MQIDSLNTGPFPVLCLLNEISDSTILDFFPFSLKNIIQKFFHSNYLYSSNLQIRGSNSDDLE